MAAVTIALLLGTILGSFLNVVISRGPRKWGLVESADRPAGLAFPASQCENCHRKLSAHELVPVASYIALRGTCRACGAAIGLRHLLVEIAGGAILALAVWRHGVSADAAAMAVLLFLLLALAVIDAETGYLPDALTWPLLALGLAASFLPGGTGPLQAALGAAIGGGGLWLLATLYKRFRHRDGLGGGDVKLLAAGGAWCGAYALPVILLVASLSGLLAAVAGMVLGQKERAMTAELRFGPYLAGAIALVYAIGEPLALAS
ncbi:prepilin peptidase [Parvularcula lutaonensis]|uniref:Prepilin leader peptidase/N-methyltransferase n=1 Tax=Parvularcula lutaonensis TaxID=491923 RepID=A0ABV7MEY9_9PROT|nr:A24 family peptidase [Parvularcula lutaonensis]GGY52669.1 type 4 prepilin-like proteins leader peptide-processing enzyme [Parvularcula lutaonensis]